MPERDILTDPNSQADRQLFVRELNAVYNIPPGVTDEQAQEIIERSPEWESYMLSRTPTPQDKETGLITPASRAAYLSAETGLQIDEGEWRPVENADSYHITRTAFPILRGSQAKAQHIGNRHGHGIQFHVFNDPLTGEPKMLARNPGEPGFREVDSMEFTKGDTGDILGHILRPENIAGMAAGGATARVPGLLMGPAVRAGAEFFGGAAGNLVEQGVRSGAAGGLSDAFPQGNIGDDVSGISDRLTEAGTQGGLNAILGAGMEPFVQLGQMFARGNPSVAGRTLKEVNEVLGRELGATPLKYVDNSPALRAMADMAARMNPNVEEQRRNQFHVMLNAVETFISKVAPTKEMTVGGLLRKSEPVRARLLKAASSAPTTMGKEQHQAFVQSLSNVFKQYGEWEASVWGAVRNLTHGLELSADVGRLQRMATRQKSGVQNWLRVADDAAEGAATTQRIDAGKFDAHLQVLQDEILGADRHVRNVSVRVNHPAFGAPEMQPTGTMEQLKQWRTRAYHLSQQGTGNAAADARDLYLELSHTMDLTMKKAGPQARKAYTAAEKLTKQKHELEDLVMTSETLRLVKEEPALLVDYLIQPNHPDKIRALKGMLKELGNEQLWDDVRGEFVARTYARPGEVSKVLDRFPDDASRRLIFSSKDVNALRKWETAAKGINKRFDDFSQLAMTEHRLGRRAIQGMLAGDPAIIRELMKETGGKNGPLGRMLRSGFIGQIIEGATQRMKGQDIIVPRRAAEKIEKLMQTQGDLMKMILTPKDVKILSHIEDALSFLKQSDMATGLQVASTIATAGRITEPRAAAGAMGTMIRNSIYGRILLSPKFSSIMFRVPGQGGILARGLSTMARGGPALQYSHVAAVAIANSMSETFEDFDLELADKPRGQRTINMRRRPRETTMLDMFPEEAQP